MSYEMIRSNFLKKLWTVQMVKISRNKGLLKPEQFNQIMYDGAEAGIITVDQYQQETGEVYVSLKALF